MEEKGILIYKQNDIFNEILCKNFPEQYNLFKIENYLQIENLFKDLNNNRKETDLYFRWYDPNMKDIDIYSIQKVNNPIDGDFWLLNNKELYIKCLWIYKYDVGYDFILIENKPMKTNEIFKKPNDTTANVGVIFENGEERERYVKNMLFIISPDKCSMFNAFHNGAIETLFNQYKNNNYTLNEELFEKLMYPNIQRNIRGMITYD